ncbi:MAG: ferritin-like domain-containing protein [Candidatus Omnitrophica bacterium]|nr:ferritin-like domain-containing protein [Candidatus Woesearchaeota archaeon]MBI2175047.1 ferritin-like domain-containing protein [Candidatus Omnitrophota bacterium]
MSKDTIIGLLNEALALEHAAFVQYLSHAEVVEGEISEPIIARLKEIAEDEKKHQDTFRKLIGLLGGVPSMAVSETHKASSVKEILMQNLEDEKHAVRVYRKILEELRKEKGQGFYDFILEHDVRHVLMEEQEHITEIELLLSRQGESY